MLEIICHSGSFCFHTLAQISRDLRPGWVLTQLERCPKVQGSHTESTMGCCGRLFLSEYLLSILSEITSFSLYLWCFEDCAYQYLVVAVLACYPRRTFSTGGFSLFLSSQNWLSLPRQYCHCLWSGLIIPCTNLVTHSWKRQGLLDSKF